MLSNEARAALRAVVTRWAADQAATGMAVRDAVFELMEADLVEPRLRHTDNREFFFFRPTPLGILMVSTMFDQEAGDA